jgi:hypothetical protein
MNARDRFSDFLIQNVDLGNAAWRKQHLKSKFVLENDEWLDFETTLIACFRRITFVAI